ncbi:hypothetical protein LOTGIDRAFT_175607 [Lottia gigantea]|uniref:Uncharacterized protein n=1 Tax=Lottia gigantea TaxID=225164 RepID=V4A8T6_LOTGI|nr:hypothetical protein LOTGIDRAFT_175607 [Lottia gigantea]ESO93172.1 hypothetical protein LOTGIDRAFT_175607 [Lottia gigantea]
MGLNISKTSQWALQAGGIAPLKVLGEIHTTLSYDNKPLRLDALVVDELDVDVLAGTSFMSCNDISVRPSTREISLHGIVVYQYGDIKSCKDSSTIRRTQAYVLRTSSQTVVWPGDFLEVCLRPELQKDQYVAIETRTDTSSSPHTKLSRTWPQSNILPTVAGKVRIPNLSTEPHCIRRNSHFCQVQSVTSVPTNPVEITLATQSHTTKVITNSQAVRLNPDSILTPC